MWETGANDLTKREEFCQVGKCFEEGMRMMMIEDLLDWGGCGGGGGCLGGLFNMEATWGLEIPSENLWLWGWDLCPSLKCSDSLSSTPEHDQISTQSLAEWESLLDWSSIKRQDFNTICCKDINLHCYRDLAGGGFEKCKRKINS